MEARRSSREAANQAERIRLSTFESNRVVIPDGQQHTLMQFILQKAQVSALFEGSSRSKTGKNTHLISNVFCMCFYADRNVERYIFTMFEMV